MVEKGITREVDRKGLEVEREVEEMESEVERRGKRGRKDIKRGKERKKKGKNKDTWRILGQKTSKHRNRETDKETHGQAHT